MVIKACVQRNGPLFSFQTSDSHDTRDVSNAPPRDRSEHQAAAPGRHRAVPGQGHRAAPSGRGDRGRAHAERYPCVLGRDPGLLQLAPGALSCM